VDAPTVPPVAADGGDEVHELAAAAPGDGDEGFGDFQDVEEDVGGYFEFVNPRATELEGDYDALVPEAAVRSCLRRQG